MRTIATLRTSAARRCSSRSKYTLPVQNTTRSTLFAGRSSTSSMTSWKLPCVRSSSADTDSLCRSRLFGVMTISGLRNVRSICRRSMWNICAGVDGTQTCMLFSAQSCRKRSRRAEECSGPCPS